MAKKQFRGIEVNQEIDPNHQLRDIRTMQEKIVDFMKVPNNVVLVLTVMLGASWWYKIMAPFLAIIAFFIVKISLGRKETAPLKMPMQAKCLDSNELNPGNYEMKMAEGIFFLGNEFRTGKEIWLTNSDCRQHFLVLGTTGAGKTEALLGFAANALSWSSGFLFCDGKGDVSLFAKVNAMCRRFGREDDILVLNFMTGNSDVEGGAEVMSNSLNPFATGSSDGLTQMVVSLMDDAGGDGAMWKGRATAMLTGVMRALCWMRRAGIIELNVGTIRDFMGLPKIIDLSNKDKYPEMPEAIRGTIKSYLQSLPGFQPEKGAKQAQTTLDQHGYLEMQFTKILGSLADVYGHIFKTPYGEVDMYDVVLNRRVLVIMLPALEKSADELGNLGKIVCASLKGMMGGTLGSKIEGTWKDVVDNRPTNSPSPFLVILDEVGYYTVEGLALMAAQARSLGFSMIYASQDIPAMKKKNEKEAASIIANTNTKIFMRLEEPNETAKLAIDRGAKAMRARTSGYERQSGEFTSHQYMDATGTQFEDQDRIHLTDLTGQTEGEMHIIHKDRIVRAKTWYADAPGSIDVNKLQLGANHFIQVARPDPTKMEEENQIPEVLERLLDKSLPNELKQATSDALSYMKQNSNETMAKTVYAFRTLLSKKRNSIESSLGAIYFIFDKDAETSDDFVSSIQTINKGKGLLKTQSGHSDSVMDMSNTDETMEKLAGRSNRKNNVDSSVSHSIITDDDKKHDMSKHLTSSESILQALAVLDFDEEEEDVNVKVEDELDQILGNTERYSSDEKERIKTIVEDVEREQRKIEDIHQETMSGQKIDNNKVNIMEKEDDENEDDETTDFLDSLLVSDDED